MTTNAMHIVNTIVVSLILATVRSSGLGVRRTFYYYLVRLATPGGFSLWDSTRLVLKVAEKSSQSQALRAPAVETL
jgi:hypothetical protein